MKHFFILGNGHSGSSLLRGLLDSHSKLSVEFENFRYKDIDIKEEQFLEWELAKKKAIENGMIYGNKIPIEQFISAHWTDSDIVEIMDRGYNVVWLQRRFSKYDDSDKCPRHADRYKKNWEWGQLLYWQMKEKHPSKIIYVSFEDILFQSVLELIRICGFLGVDFEHEMIDKGSKNTGHYRYKYNTIDINRM